ncbi:MAG: YfhO family protein [Oscillospiraceae bacterium]|nr:YfhO family protein [Oscillospiraceae bacterium]
MEENVNIQGQPENNGSEAEASSGELNVKKINVNIIDGGRDGSNISEPKKENKFLSVIGGFIKSKRSYIFAFFIPVLLLFAAYACFGVHPFGDMSVLVLDLNGQYVYYFENLRDVLHGNGSPFISWSRNLTGEIMGMFAYYLASPFTLIPMLLPRSMMTESLLIMQLCKVGTASVTFNYYLRRSKGCKGSTAMLFGILYSLMGYMIVQLMNPMWLDGLIYLPLIVYGIEKIIDDNCWLRFIIPLALMYMAHFYIGWMITFFSIIYFLYYYFAGKKNYTHSFKSFFFSGVKFAVGGVIAAMSAAWVLLPLYNSLKLGKFEFSNPSYALKTQFDFIDFFKNILPNVYDTCRPEGSPVVYCGVLTVILIPLFFLNSKIRFRQKMGLGAVLMSVLLSMYLSTADLAWHGFQVPNWLPYRYSFTFSFVLLVMAAMTFERLEGISIKEIGITGFGLMLYAFYVGRQDFKGVDLVMSVWYTVIFTLIYCIVLRSIKMSDKSRRAVLTFVIGIFTAGELFGSTLSTMEAINKDVVYSKYSSYNRYITLGRDTVKKILDQDSFEEGGVYRIEKNFHRTVNDAMAMGSFGVSHSSSTLNAAPIQFLRRLGFSYGGHYIKYKGSTYVTDAILGIKYVMEKDTIPNNEGDETITDTEEKIPENKHYDKLILTNKDDKEIFAVYENPNALPIAFMADSSILDVEFGTDNPFENQNKLLSHLVSDEYTQYFKEISIDRTLPENAKQTSYGAHTKYVPIEEGKNSHIEFIFDAPTEDMIYLYLPSSYERKVNLWLNKEFLDYYFEGGNMVIQTLGKFDKGEEISLIVTITEEKNEVLFKDKLIYYLDEEKFTEDINKLKQNGLKMTRFEEDHIKGEITAEKDGVMFTTISWEPGWTIKVDGEKVEPVKVCDALIGVELTAGTHEIEMTFFPAGLSAGIILSLCGIIAIIIIAVTEKKSDKILLDRLND